MFEIIKGVVTLSLLMVVMFMLLALGVGHYPQEGNMVVSINNWERPN